MKLTATLSRDKLLVRKTMLLLLKKFPKLWDIYQGKDPYSISKPTDDSVIAALSFSYNSFLDV
jgi:hypothetical protein